MNEELDVNEILTAMREQIGIMAQEIAILKTALKKVNNESCNGACSNTKND